MGRDGQERRFSLVYPDWVPPEVDTTVAHPARRYDYWLGGKDNYPADRESGDAIAAVFPTIRTTAVENRRFMVRAVRFLTREAGMRQFLDVGTGIPSSPNVHEVAQSIAPESRVVYVDNDPIVLTHARALLTSTPQGAIAHVHADLRDPQAILTHPDLVEVLDLRQPTALLLVAILHFIKDADDPYGAVARLTKALAPGSYLVISHATADSMPPETAKAVDVADSARRVPFQFRTRTQVARFLDGMDLLAPGIVSVSEWRAEHEPKPRPSVADTAVYGAIARI
jgi:SAM-dependent methyltransferase